MEQLKVLVVSEVPPARRQIRIFKGVPSPASDEGIFIRGLHYFTATYTALSNKLGEFLHFQSLFHCISNIYTQEVISHYLVLTE